MNIEPVAWRWEDKHGCVYITGDERRDDVPERSTPLCLHSEAMAEIERLTASRDGYVKQCEELQRLHDDVHLWRFWNEKARELAASNDNLRQQLSEERSKALEDAASYVERIAHQGIHASMWRNTFKQVSDAIRAMKDKP